MEYVNIEIDGKIVNLPEPCSFNVTKNDLTDNRFDIDKWTARTKIIDIKISLLKQKLANTDYQAIKYAEGAMTAAEYAPYKADRAKWRAEINDLEKKL